MRRPRLTGRRRRARRSRGALGGGVEPAELGELVHQPGRHALDGARAYVAAQSLLEAVAAPAVVAVAEMQLGLLPFGVRERAVEEVLEELLAPIAWRAHYESAPSARCCFNARRPRCRRDITVPIG